MRPVGNERERRAGPGGAAARRPARTAPTRARVARAHGRDRERAAPGLRLRLTAPAWLPRGPVCTCRACGAAGRRGRRGAAPQMSRSLHSSLHATGLASLRACPQSGFRCARLPRLDRAGRGAARSGRGERGSGRARESTFVVRTRSHAKTRPNRRPGDGSRRPNANRRVFCFRFFLLFTSVYAVADLLLSLGTWVLPG